MSTFAPSIAQRKSPIVSIYGGDIPTLLYSDPRLGGDGKTRLNPDKGLAKWRWISATFGGAGTVALANSATTVGDLTVKASGSDDEGDFEAGSMLVRSINSSGAPLRVAIQPYVNTPTINRFLSNQPISSNLLAGTAQLPGVLRMGIYCLPETSWKFTVQRLGAASATVTVALHGRQFVSCSPCVTENQRKRAQHLQWMHPYWIGPQDPSEPRYTGPEITLPASGQVELTFPVPSSADFLMFGMLDDSTGSSGGEPGIYAQVRQNDTQRGLIDNTGLSTVATGASALGISWRDFLAIPTVDVTGFPGGRINAYSLAPSMAGYTHLIPRGTQLIVRFVNPNASNVITLRPALFGLLVYGRQPPDRQTSVDGAANRERVKDGEEFLRRMGLTSAFEQGRAR